MFNLEQQQLSHYLRSLEAFKHVSKPQAGWIRAIREGLRMNRRQLGERLSLSTSRIQRIEADENSGSVTLRTMQQTAAAMDCVFVYAILPRTSLEENIENQALLKAAQQLGTVNQTMVLEDQAISSSENNAMMKRLAERLTQEQASKLWDK
jgi:predicted DNA-binding mobile mystery protein A